MLGKEVGLDWQLLARANLLEWAEPQRSPQLDRLDVPHPKSELRYPLRLRPQKRQSQEKSNAPDDGGARTNTPNPELR